jgi:hypothetical protein
MNILRRRFHTKLNTGALNTSIRTSCLGPFYHFWPDNYI